MVHGLWTMDLFRVNSFQFVFKKTLIYLKPEIKKAAPQEQPFKFLIINYFGISKIFASISLLNSTLLTLLVISNPWLAIEV